MRELEKSRGLAEAAVTGGLQRKQALQWMFRILAVAASGTVLAVAAAATRDTQESIIFLTAAAVATAASAGLLVMALAGQRAVERGKTKGVLGVLADAGPRLVDKEWNLTGRPDYVMETKAGNVPVDLRGGRAPEHPPSGHRLQMACYLRLLEARDGKPPPYGIIQYRDGLFRVEWNEALRAEMKSVLAKMAAAKAAGKADRDHENPNRCRTCVRRVACDQRLA